MKDFSIAFGYPYGNGFDPSFVSSVEGLLLHEVSKPVETRILGSILKKGSCYVADNRERICVQLVNETQDDWVVMIDPDIGFSPDILERAYKLIQEYPDARIIAGRVNLLNGLPVFYYVDRELNANVYYCYPFKGLKAFDLVGTGIIFIHREVIFKLNEKLGHTHMFSKVIDPSSKMGYGDDFSFMIRASAMGYKIYGAWEIYGQHYKGGVPVPQAYYEYEQLVVKPPIS